MQGDKRLTGKVVRPNWDGGYVFIIDPETGENRFAHYSFFKTGKLPAKRFIEAGDVFVRFTPAPPEPGKKSGRAIDVEVLQ